MRIAQTTQLLSTIARAVRQKRPKFTAPRSFFIEQYPGYAEIWFPSGGCPWDKLGHCTMCNYGDPVEPDTQHMYQAVDEALTALGPRLQEVWVSAYNSLDTREVPRSVRERIFQRVASSPASLVITETHPASVQRDVIAECVEILEGKTFAIQLGVETMDEFVRIFCLNKPYFNSLLHRAIVTIHDAGAQVYANILVGTPFLAPREAILDAAASVRMAIRAGADRVILFPNYVKEHTVAEVLASGGHYKPVGLWGIKEVVAATQPFDWPRLGFAWIDLKDHPGAPAVLSGDGAKRDRQLHDLLYRFNSSYDPTLLQEVVALDSPQSGNLKSQPDEPLPSRLARIYEWLTTNCVSAELWAQNSSAVLQEMEAAWSECHLSQMSLARPTSSPTHGDVGERIEL